MIRAAVIAAVMLSSTTATADRWLAAEMPAAWAVSQPQARTFHGGALPALGLYQPVTPWLALALRGRAGVLGDGATPMNGLRDPGRAGLGTLSLAARWTGPRTWIEVAGGGGLTGLDWVPAVEVGAGWSVDLGRFEIGPSFRYLRVAAPEDAGMGSAHLALVGLELRGGGRRRAAVPHLPRAVAVAGAPGVVDRFGEPLVDRAPACLDAPEECADAAAEADGDAVVEVLESCRALTGVVEGGTPGEGCSDGGAIQVESDRIILADRVLFAVARARVRRHARPVIRAIARAWLAHDTWERLIIEGHSDARGDAAYNLWLSQERAERARAALIEAGVPAEQIEAKGYGASRPRSRNLDANRRVEFVIIPRRPR